MIYRIELPKYFEKNQLYLGDNLEVMKSLPSMSIDLIYLDPPFFSGRVYTEESKVDDDEVRSFDDTFNGNLKEFLNFLGIRIFEMRRLLKPTGSIFVHMDDHAIFEIKVLIMDRFFGRKHFINNIIWCYSGANVTISRFPQKHDIILWYSKGDKYTFNPQDILIKKANDDSYKIDDQGNRYITKYGKKYLVKHDFLLEGKIPEDWWVIPFLSPAAKERVDYPTQKPIELIERIIKAASNKGDTVADFFGGSGTTAVVSQQLNRNWITCDKSSKSIEVIKTRLLGNKSIKDRGFQTDVGAMFESM